MIYCVYSFIQVGEDNTAQYSICDLYVFINFDCIFKQQRINIVAAARMVHGGEPGDVHKSA